MKPHRFPLGRMVKVIKIADDLRCNHVGLIGEVLGWFAATEVRPEPRYFVAFPNIEGHIFYESELEEALQ